MLWLSYTRGMHNPMSILFVLQFESGADVNGMISPFLRLRSCVCCVLCVCVCVCVVCVCVCVHSFKEGILSFHENVSFFEGFLTRVYINEGFTVLQNPSV